MSHITNIIIITSILEDQSNIGEVEDILHKSGLTGNYVLTEATTPVGYHALETPVWYTAVNYLDIPEFVAQFYAIPWRYEVKLLIADQNDRGYWVYERYGKKEL
jgi:hypothetical protein